MCRCVSTELTCFQGAEHNERRVCDVELGCEAARKDGGQTVDGQQVDDEGVAAP